MRDEEEHLIYQIFLPSAEGKEDWRDRLPHLTSNGTVNVQLYAFLGVVLRQFVQSWHTAIVDDDAFVFAILETLSKAIKDIERRASKVRFAAWKIGISTNIQLDLDRMLLDDIPFLIDSHVKGTFFCREFG